MKSYSEDAARKGWVILVSLRGTGRREALFEPYQ